MSASISARRRIDKVLQQMGEFSQRIRRGACAWTEHLHRRPANRVVGPLGGNFQASRIGQVDKPKHLIAFAAMADHRQRLEE